VEGVVALIHLVVRAALAAQEAVAMVAQMQVGVMALPILVEVLVMQQLAVLVLSLLATPIHLQRHQQLQAHQQSL
jgi:hypothetical protein